jgi:hypothetical protein
VLPTYNPDAKWYYLERQRPDELTIMKIVDSDQTAKATCEFLPCEVYAEVNFPLQVVHTLRSITPKSTLTVLLERVLR